MFARLLDHWPFRVFRAMRDDEHAPVGDDVECNGTEGSLDPAPPGEVLSVKELLRLDAQLSVAEAEQRVPVEVIVRRAIERLAQEGIEVRAEEDDLTTEPDDADRYE